MKKFLMFLSFILCACTTEPVIRDEGCSDISQVRILQTLEDGALAQVCKFDWDKLSTDCSAFNQTVYIMNQNDIQYYDDLIVKVPNGKCLSKHGVYQYESKGRGHRTVPALEMIDAK